jgi:SAM-dependent methyltransferase
MKILNPSVQAELAAGRPLRLNLGAGEQRIDGFFGIDHLPLTGTDILADLNEPLPLLPDGSVEHVRTRHVLEHVRNFLPLMEELYRILRPGGRIDIIVPHFSNPLAYSDPTHVRFFGLYSFYYMVDPARQLRRKVPAFYTSARFQVERLSIRFDRETFFGKLTAPVYESIVNAGAWTQALYERRFVWAFPASELHVTLRR